MNNPDSSQFPGPVTSRVDLHTHSSASDGSDSPEQLIAHALELHLAAIALTDHDTTSGLHRFLQAAQGKDIIAVPGVELSAAFFGRDIHIIGLFVDPDSVSLNALLDRMREERDRRNFNMLAKLREGGYSITDEDLAAEADGESVGRPHMARALIRKGYFKTPFDAFAKCLKRGTPFYIPRTGFTPSELIQTIHGAGGLAIWAHPLHAQSGGRSFLRKFLKALVPLGLDGMETYYSMFTEAQQVTAASQAEEFHLLPSGGSDYHGLNQPTIALGSGRGSLAVPFSVFETLRDAQNARFHR